MRRSQKASRFVCGTKEVILLPYDDDDADDDDDDDDDDEIATCEQNSFQTITLTKSFTSTSALSVRVATRTSGGPRADAPRQATGPVRVMKRVLGRSWIHVVFPMDTRGPPPWMHVVFAMDARGPRHGYTWFQP